MDRRFQSSKFSMGVLVRAGAVLLAIAALRAVGSVPRASSHSRGHREEELTFVEIAAAFSRAGLDARAFAVTTAPSGKVAPSVNAGLAYLQPQWERLQMADAAVMAARAHWETLAQLVGSGLGDQKDVADQDAALAALQDALQVQEALLRGLQEAAGGVMGEDSIDSVRRIRQNAGWEVPTQYLVVDRTEREWVALRDALADIRSSKQFGLEPSDESLALVVQADADPAVVTARLGLEHLVEIEAEWNAAMRPW